MKLAKGVMTYGKIKIACGKAAVKKEQKKRKSEKTTKSILDLSITPVMISINAPTATGFIFQQDFLNSCYIWNNKERPWQLKLMLRNHFGLRVGTLMSKVSGVKRNLH